MTNYDNETIKIFKLSEEEAKNLNHPFVGTEHIILGILKSNTEINDVFRQNNVSYELFRKNLITKTYGYKVDNNIIYTPLLKRIIMFSNNIKDIFLKIVEEDEGIGISILNSLDIDVNNIYKTIKSNEKYYGINITELAKSNELNTIIGRDKEINNIIEILGRKNKCNPLLIGEAGVGKTAIVEELANRIVRNDIPSFLKNYTILSISMSSLVSGTKYRGEFEEKLEKIIKQVINKKVIIFIDEIHTIVGVGGSEGAIDASNILKPYLARNSIKCIGSTTINEYNKTIKKDKALDRRFNKVIINEPSNKEVKDILYGIKNSYELFHNVIINNKSLDYIQNKASLIKDKYEPDKSIDILDNVCTKASIYLKSNELNKYKDELNKIIYNKNKCIEINDFKKASYYKKLENSINKKICKYKPKINNKFIDKVININKYNSIGF